jgi:hypothetical protein
MSRLAASWILVLAAACGGSKSSSTTTTPKEVADPIPKTAGPACDVVADKLSIVVEAETPDNQPAAKAKIDSHCKNDKWSDEARSCFATAENDDEVGGCKKMLTDAQRGAWGGDGKEPKETPAAAPAPGTSADSAKKKKPSGTRSADPEEGGE